MDSAAALGARPFRGGAATAPPVQRDHIAKAIGDLGDWSGDDEEEAEARDDVGVMPRVNSRGSNRANWRPSPPKRVSKIMEGKLGGLSGGDKEGGDFFSPLTSSFLDAKRAARARKKHVMKATLHIFEAGRKQIKMPMTIVRHKTSFSEIVHMAATKLMVDVADVEGFTLVRSRWPATRCRALYTRLCRL